ncbi:unnamed protein product, partial [Closterium sp. Naga37s-1]
MLPVSLRSLTTRANRAAGHLAVTPLPAASCRVMLMAGVEATTPTAVQDARTGRALLLTSPPSPTSSFPPRPPQSSAFPHLPSPSPPSASGGGFSVSTGVVVGRWCRALVASSWGGFSVSTGVVVGRWCRVLVASSCCDFVFPHLRLPPPPISFPTRRLRGRILCIHGGGRGGSGGSCAAAAGSGVCSAVLVTLPPLTSAILPHLPSLSPPGGSGGGSSAAQEGGPLYPWVGGGSGACGCNSGGKSSVSTGVVVGIVLGAVVLLLGVVILAVFWYQRRRRAKAAAEKGATDEGDGGGSGAAGAAENGACSEGGGPRQQQFKEPNMKVEEMASKNHVNLVRLLGYCSHMDAATGAIEQILICEYMHNGDLEGWVGPGVAAPLNLRQHFVVLIGVAQGPQYLHSLIIHSHAPHS